MQAFGAANADCLEWTNACLVCSRLALAPDPEATDTVVDKGGESHDGESRHTEMACSTPGIACQPKSAAPQCGRRARLDFSGGGPISGRDRGQAFTGMRRAA
jgi:hypothetical protein